MQKLERQGSEAMSGMMDSQVMKRGASIHSKGMISPSGGTGAKQLPVYIQQQIASAAPQYPALKMNVSQLQQDVSDILEESFEERRRESVNEKPQSKIKKILNAPPRATSMEQVNP